MLAQFQLACGTVPFRAEIRFPKLPTPKSESAQLSASPAAPRIAAAATAPRTGDAGTGPETPTTRQPDYWGERQGTGLVIRGPIRTGHDQEIVLAEIESTGTDQTTQSVRFPVTLTRVKNGTIGESHVLNVPWPINRQSDHGTLHIGPLDEASLPYLDRDQVSMLLTIEKGAFAAVTMQRDADGHDFAELRLPLQKSMAADPQTTWLLRMSEERGDA